MVGRISGKGIGLSLEWKTAGTMDSVSYKLYK